MFLNTGVGVPSSHIDMYLQLHIARKHVSVDRLKVRCGDVHLMDSKDDGGVQVREVVYYDINDG